VPHSAPMLSIENGYSLAEWREFDARVRKGLGIEVVPYVVELKIDGVAIVLRYEDGASRAASRAATGSSATT